MSRSDARRENKHQPHFRENQLRAILYASIYNDIHNMTATTVRIDTETKALISERKNHSRESLEDVIKRMIKVYDVDRHLCDGEIKAVERGIQDVRVGRTISGTDLRKKLGLTH